MRVILKQGFSHGFDQDIGRHAIRIDDYFLNGQVPLRVHAPRLIRALLTMPEGLWGLH